MLLSKRMYCRFCGAFGMVSLQGTTDGLIVWECDGCSRPVSLVTEPKALKAVQEVERQ